MAYYSQEMIDAERNYEIYNVKLFAIVESFYHWRHYFNQPCYFVEMFTDYNDLRVFMTTYKLT